jgi:hypothetical protein
MYRRGIPTSKIAATVGAAATTVRYHLQMAKKAEPRLQDEHRAALVPVARVLTPSMRNLRDILTFYAIEDRLPLSHGKTPRERALGVWLLRRRREAAEGNLASAYRDALAAIPGWDSPSTRKADDAGRWQKRLEEIAKLRDAGGDWPRHQKTDDRVERTLGVWLHTQRIDYRAGKLSSAKEYSLNEVLPGWREGRGRRGGYKK